MKWFKFVNSNSIHNGINVLILILGAVVGFDWTLFGIEPEMALKITGGLSLLKLVINAVRDGPKGMVEPPPPAEEK